MIGELTNRFGSQRQDSGLSWKGLFISAKTGREVKAIAGGRVVYADWLRGFGNLLILDHGDGYMSLYGNNESLLKQVGDDANAGDTIASVGATRWQPGIRFILRTQISGKTLRSAPLGNAEVSRAPAGVSRLLTKESSKDALANFGRSA